MHKSLGFALVVGSILACLGFAPDASAMDLECDVEASGFLAAPTDTARWNLSISAGQVLSLTIVEEAGGEPNFGPVWRIVASDGTYPMGNSFLALGYHLLTGLAPNGNPYEVQVVDAGANGTGPYSLNYRVINAIGACEDSALVCDVEHAGTIETRTDADFWSFSVAANEVTSLTIVEEPGGETNFGPVWRVVAADGTFPMGSSFRDLGYAALTGLTPAGNPHRIEVVDSSVNGTGPYSLNLHRLTASTACEDSGLVCDVEHAGTIETRTDSDLWSFSVAADEVTSLTIVEEPGGGPDFGPKWRVVAADGSFPMGSSFQDVGYIALTGLTPAGNPHRIEVVDGNVNDTGPYSLNVHRLTASTACEDSVLVCDVQHSGTIETRTDSDLWSFSVAANEVTSLTIVEEPGGETNFGPVWRVVAADGTFPMGSSFQGLGYAALTGLTPAGNPHRIEVIDSSVNGTGPYSLNLHRLTASTACEDSALECDVQHSGTIETRTDSDLWSFSVAADEVTSLTIVEEPGGGTNFGPKWRVVAADGTFPMGSSFQDVGYIALTGLTPAGNPHRIEIVDGNVNDTGPYSLNLHRLTASTACEDSVLVCDVEHAGTIETRTDSDLWSFSVTADEVTSLTIVEEPGGGTNFGPKWRVVAADGTFPMGSSFQDVGYIALTGLTPAGNPHRIEVIDSSVNDSGPYSLNLHRLTASTACEDSALECDVEHAGTIETRTDSDLWSFSVVANEVTSLTIVEEPGGGTNFSPVWRVVAADGTFPMGSSFQNLGYIALTGLTPAGNPHRIEVIDSSVNDSGPYSLNLHRLTASTACEDSALECDVEHAGTIETRTDSDLWSFSVTADEVTSLTIVEEPGGGTNFGPVWRVVAADGTFPMGSSFQNLGYIALTGLTPAGNPHRIEVVDGNVNDTGPYSLNLRRLTASTACEEGVIFCGDELADSIETRTDSDLWEFHVADGMSVSITLTELAGGEAAFGPIWRIVAGDGSFPEGSSFKNPGTWTVGPLSASGNPHHIEIVDQGVNATGPYSIALGSTTGQCPVADAPEPPVPPQAPPAHAYLECTSPNPFQGAADLAFGLPETAPVSIRLFDVQGRTVTTILEGALPGGHYRTSWDGDARSGRSVGAGIYFVVMQTPSGRQTLRLVKLTR